MSEQRKCQSATNIKTNLGFAQRELNRRAKRAACYERDRDVRALADIKQQISEYKDNLQRHTATCLECSTNLEVADDRR